MAIKAQASKKSKQTLLSLMVILFMGWLILLGWAVSLWCFFGFNSALKALNCLSRQQITAVAEVNDFALADKIKAGLESLPTQELTQAINSAGVLIKHRLNTALPEEFSELKDFFIFSKKAWLLIQLTTQIIFIKLHWIIFN